MRKQKAMKLSQILFEVEDAAQNPDSDTFQMYHGGKKMTSIPTGLKSVKQGRYESGIGINLTNNFETAKRYAGGGRVVHIFDIDKDIVHTNDPRAELNLEEVIQFLKDVKRLPKRELIISDLRRYSERRGNIEQIPADVLNNLIINHEAGAGQAGLEIVRFFLNKGIDGVFTTQGGGEVWFVLFNPSKIKNIAVVKGYPEKDRIMLPNPYV